MPLPTGEAQRETKYPSLGTVHGADPLIVDVSPDGAQVWLTVRGQGLIMLNANYADLIGMQLIEAADRISPKDGAGGSN